MLPPALKRATSPRYRAATWTNAGGRPRTNVRAVYQAPVNSAGNGRAHGKPGPGVFWRLQTVAHYPLSISRQVTGGQGSGRRRQKQSHTHTLRVAGTLGGHRAKPLRVKHYYLMLRVAGDKQDWNSLKRRSWRSCSRSASYDSVRALRLDLSSGQKQADLYSGNGGLPPRVGAAGAANRRVRAARVCWAGGRHGGMARTQSIGFRYAARPGLDFCARVSPTHRAYTATCHLSKAP